jgi:nicotinic acetylcholine receptor
MKDYNRYVLPVQSINQTVNVTLGLKLSQLSDIDERNQIMTTNVWLEHVRYIYITENKNKQLNI